MAMTPEQLAAWYGMYAQQAIQEQSLALQQFQPIPAPVPQLQQQQQQIVPHREGSKGSGQLPEGCRVLGDFVGTVQEFEENKGFGFVASDPLREQGYKKDPFCLRSQLTGLKLGDTVNFTAIITDRGALQGWNITYISDGVPLDQRLRKKLDGPPKPKRTHPSMVQEGDDIGHYQGTITGIHETGASFIRADDLKEKGWDCDAVLDKDLNAGFEFGDVVTFTAYMSQTKKLCAKDVTFVQSSYIGAFAGSVKSYNTLNGYGFLDCEELREQGHDQDVYVHKKHSGLEQDVGVGDKVTFQCYLNLKGQPQAKKVIVVESAAPAPICVARALAPEDQALATTIRENLLKRPISMVGSSSSKGDDGKGKKGKGKGKKGKDKDKDPDQAYAALPLGIALMMKRAKGE